MRALALIVVVAVAGCQLQPRPHLDRRTQLMVRREQLRGNQNMAVVGIVVGVVAGVVGGVVLHRGIELRGSEATADTEGGLGELLFGMLLTGSAVLVTGGSGIALGVYTYQLGQADDEIRRIAP